MNKEKVISFIKSKTVVCIISFVFGATLFSGGSASIKRQLSESKGQVTTLQSKLKESETNLEDALAKLKASEGKADREAQDKTKVEAEAKTKTLSNGNYVAGKDFEAGIYTITAIKGGGTVCSSNMNSGGLNAIMGIKGDMYETEYKNIKLPKDTTLTISGVTIKLTPVE